MKNNIYKYFHLYHIYIFLTAQLDNMMLHGTWPSPVLKICDFGFSKDEAGQSVSKSTCGTPEYMAPEVCMLQTGSWNSG